MSTFYCYLKPAARRTNLKIHTSALCEKLLFRQNRCVGVRYSIGGKTHEAYADCEVIISGGAFNSPQLLELSGIGHPAHLANLNIPILHALHGVGENLREHFSPRMKWHIPEELNLTYNAKMKGIGPVLQLLRYLFTGTGILGLTSSPIRCFFRSREGLQAPDATVAWFPFLIGDKFTLSDASGVTLIAHALRAESTGSVHISSSDPKIQPIIRYNALSTTLDCEITLAAMRMARRIMSAPALQGIAAKELAPGIELQDDHKLLDWARQTGDATYHPVGTCKMGNDTLAVVDERLRVHGINRLRVVDASIMPTQTSGNTNAPTIMIAEKASKMIIEDARN